MLFADVRLERSEEIVRLRQLGLRITRSTEGNGKPGKLAQPCAAFDGCRCQVYEERPAYCREFECILFKNVAAKRLEAAQALRIICSARERAEKVKQLLRELGESNEHLPLAKRHRTVARRMESSELDESTADLYGQLTLAVHDLNCLLRDAFYR